MEKRCPKIRVLDLVSPNETGGLFGVAGNVNAIVFDTLFHVTNRNLLNIHDHFAEKSK